MKCGFKGYRRVIVILLILVVSLAGCQRNSEEGLSKETQSAESATDATSDTATGTAQDAKQDTSDMKLYITVNGTKFIASMAENAATEKLREHLEAGELELTLSDYSGFEKVGPLGFSLPTKDKSMTSRSGDILLYNGSQVVVFYGSNSWSYTKLAHVDDLDGWEEVLGKGDATVILSLTESRKE